jgi:indole-3-glycerol phosphate synthase
MSILNKIITHKQKEVQLRRELYPIPLLERSIYFHSPLVSMRTYLLRPDKSGIIAEFKRQSPSRGAINPYASVEEVSIGYMQAGASALSVLTDAHFFGGSNEDLTEARNFNFCPILRKDFIIDEYQVLEARSIGADTILLIAECLDEKQVRKLAKLAKSLGLEVLMEVHSLRQLSKVNEYIDMVGVNNRNLEDFSVSLKTSLDLIDAIPEEMVAVSESGIKKPADIALLREAGYQGFLIGQQFMEAPDPAKACRLFIQQLPEKTSIQKAKV